MTATDDEAWLKALLDVEVALARAQAAVGLMPSSDASLVESACRTVRLDVKELGHAARAGGNPVIPLVTILRDRAGAAADWVHWGATSQDVMDTAMVLVARRAGEIVLDELAKASDQCARLAETHRHTLMVGRTLLQPAVPITFGLKAAGWLVAFDTCHSDLTTRISGLPAQLGGAAGTLAALGEMGPAVARAFAAELGLDEPVIPWHSGRQPTARLASTLALSSATAAKVAGDIALLMQSEVGEVYEPAAEGRGGSSTMPHKRNPVGAAAVGAAAARAMTISALFVQSVAGEYERSLVAWPVEWQTVGELLRLSGGAVTRTAETLAGLEVDVTAMARRVDDLAPDLTAERLVFSLASKLGRQEATKVVAEAVGRGGGREAIVSALRADDRVAGAFTAADIRDLLNPATYLGATDVWIDRALERAGARRTS